MISSDFKLIRPSSSKTAPEDDVFLYKKQVDEKSGKIV